MEKKRRDQHGDAPGKGTKGSGGKREKGKGLGTKKQQDLAGGVGGRGAGECRFYFTDSIHAPAPAYSQSSWGALCWCGDPWPSA